MLTREKKRKRTPQQQRAALKRRLVRENDKMARDLVLKRDHYRCVLTGKEGHLEVHHIYPKGLYRRMRWCLPNLITLDFVKHKYGVGSAHGDGIVFAEELEAVLPHERLEYLRKLSQEVNEVDLFWMVSENERLSGLCDKYGIPHRHLRITI